MSGTILFSVAHSNAARGASSKKPLLDEYSVSQRASFVAFEALSKHVPCVLLDIGPATPGQYDDLKVNAVNRLAPMLGVEIHCNAGPPYANYSEVIHHKASSQGRLAATQIARTLYEGFTSGQHKLWRSRGARANTVEEDKHLMFFLERTSVPCVIVEGLFISNPEQAEWLASGGIEAYGLLVAEGVKRWLSVKA